jgi:hypothetical protein
MGNCRQARNETRVAVRIFGTDRNGQIFSEKVFTVKVSRRDVELSGVQAQPKPDEIVGLTYGQTKAHFRVKWVGEAGSPRLGHVGLLSLSPEKPLWDFPVPEDSLDGAEKNVVERRMHPRLKCSTSVEIHTSDQTAPIRARTGDMSLGGCFVEMSNPLPKGTEFRLAIWTKDVKLWAKAQVVSSAPGFGISVKFLAMSDPERKQLQQFLDSQTRIPVRP